MTNLRRFCPRLHPVRCYRHGGNDFNLRAKLEDLIEIEKRRSGKDYSKAELPMTFSDASRLLNAAVQVVRILGWAWRWAEWWVDYDSSWEPLLELWQDERKMTKEELKIVESTRESRCDDARRCRLAAFGAALRNRNYDTTDGFDEAALDRALRAVLHTSSLVGPVTEAEIDFYVDWLCRAYKSKSRLLYFGEGKNEISAESTFCVHRDASPKFELGERPVPGMQVLSAGSVFESGVDEIDEFMQSELLVDPPLSPRRPVASKPPRSRTKSARKDKRKRSHSRSLERIGSAEKSAAISTTVPSVVKGKKRGRKPRWDPFPVFESASVEAATSPNEHNSDGLRRVLHPSVVVAAATLPKPLYTGKRRGRPPKKPKLDEEIATDAATLDPSAGATHIVSSAIMEALPIPDGAASLVGADFSSTNAGTIEHSEGDRSLVLPASDGELKDDGGLTLASNTSAAEIKSDRDNSKISNELPVDLNCDEEIPATSWMSKAKAKALAFADGVLTRKRPEVPLLTIVGVDEQQASAAANYAPSLGVSLRVEADVPIASSDTAPKVRRRGRPPSNAATAPRAESKEAKAADETPGGANAAAPTTTSRQCGRPAAQSLDGKATGDWRAPSPGRSRKRTAPSRDAALLSASQTFAPCASAFDIVKQRHRRPAALSFAPSVVHHSSPRADALPTLAFRKDMSREDELPIAELVAKRMLLLPPPTHSADALHAGAELLQRETMTTTTTTIAAATARDDLNDGFGNVSSEQKQSARHGSSSSRSNREVTTVGVVVHAVPTAADETETSRQRGRRRGKKTAVDQFTLWHK